MRQEEALDPGSIGLLGRIDRATEGAEAVGGNLVDERRFGKQQIGAVGEVDQVVRRPGVAGVRDRVPSHRQAHADVWQEVRQGPRLDVQRADRQRVTRRELAQVERRVEHPRPVEREYRTQGPGSA